MKVVDIEFLFPKSPSLLQSDDYSSLSSLLILASFAFLGHFQSNFNISRPETLEQTHQAQDKPSEMGGPARALQRSSQ
ncbi:hypothetical protein PIB30_076617 [Stylosanthes scabra]|uniref:Uncharacterized protein n=1 Tax=Stylosanthes scabra TaxID=79078 RepID=A0ABU6UQB8_9FABA|nr:hypothetical protein [Stylosanthes scabra]